MVGVSPHQNIKSQVTTKKLVPTAPQKIICAILLLFVASLRFSFPLSTFSRENSVSATNWEICSDCTSRLAASSVWRDDISRRENSAVLCCHQLESLRGKEGRCTLSCLIPNCNV